MRANSAFGVLFLVGCAFGLYQVKYLVRDIKKDVASLTGQLKEEQKAVHVLEAEWAHLIRPDRLEALSAGHLGLIPVSARQMQGISVLPARAEVLSSQDEKALPVSGEPRPMLSPTPDAQTVNYAR